MSRSSGRARLGLLSLIGAAGFVSATTLAGAVSLAASPSWTPVPGVRIVIEGTSGLAWASNRVWIAHTGPQDRVTVTSAQIAGTRLAAFQTSRLDGTLDLGVRLFVGSEFVSLPLNGSSPQTRSLLATGGLGPATGVALDLKQIAPNHAISPAAGLRLADRTVWALPGGTREFNPRAVFWVCCASDGSARELTGLIDRASSPTPVRLGLDGRGRLWLAWHDRSGTKLLEVDPSSLMPRTSKPIEAPVRGVERLELLCAAACRLVMRGSGGIHSWAPGERPTRIVKPTGPQAFPELLAASYRSGKLVVAYTVDGQTIRVVRGDARGARARVVRTSRNSSVWVLLAARAVFVPAGLVVITPKSPNANTSALLITLVPVPR